MAGAGSGSFLPCAAAVPRPRTVTATIVVARIATPPFPSAEFPTRGIAAMQPANRHTAS